MRRFFIDNFEDAIGALIILLTLVVLVSAMALMFASGEGLFAGFIVLFIGAVSVLFFGGSLYLLLGTYQNTKRTAEAMEKLVSRL